MGLVSGFVGAAVLALESDPICVHRCMYGRVVHWSTACHMSANTGTFSSLVTLE